MSWEALQVAGARVQRPLWASTSAKGPDYPDTFYVDQLIGPDSVNTMPPRATLDAFLDHGVVHRSVDQGLDEAGHVVKELAAIGIDLDTVIEQLEAAGAAILARSFDAVINSVALKRIRNSGRPLTSCHDSLAIDADGQRNISAVRLPG